MIYRYKTESLEDHRANDQRRRHTTDSDSIGRYELHSKRHGTSSLIIASRVDSKACILEVDITGIMNAREHTVQVITIPLQFTSVGILDAWAGELDPVLSIVLYQLQDDSVRDRLTLLDLLQSISHTLIELSRGNEGKLPLEC